MTFKNALFILLTFLTVHLSAMEKETDLSDLKEALKNVNHSRILKEMSEDELLIACNLWKNLKDHADNMGWLTRSFGPFVALSPSEYTDNKILIRWEDWIFHEDGSYSVPTFHIYLKNNKKDPMFLTNHPFIWFDQSFDPDSRVDDTTTLSWVIDAVKKAKLEDLSTNDPHKKWNWDEYRKIIRAE